MKKTVGLWKKRFLTLTLALVMAFSQGSFAMAAPADAPAEEELQEEPAFGEASYAEAGEEDAAAEEEAVMIAPGAEEGTEEAEEAAGAAEDTVAVSDEALPEEPSEEAIPSAADQAGNGEKTPEEYLQENFGGLQSVALQDAKPVEGGSYTANRYPTRVVIENSVEAGTEESLKDTLYGVLVLKDAFAKAAEDNTSTDYRFLMWGVPVSPGKKASIYSVHLPDGTTAELNEKDEYTLLLGRAYEWKDDNGTEHTEDFAIIGYTTSYTTSEENTGEESTEESSKEKIVYEPVNILKMDEESVKVLSAKEDAAKLEIEGKVVKAANVAGDLAITAAIQKNMSIKVNWTPTTEQNKTYKKYRLYELKLDGTKGDMVWPANGKSGGGKSCTLKAKTSDKDYAGETRADKKNIAVLPESMMYLLECRDRNDGIVDEYATVVTPWLMELKSGWTLKSMDFMFSGSWTNETLNYRLEMAGVKKEYDEKKAQTGFQEAWSTTLGILDTDYAGEYPMGGKLLADAVSGAYTNTNPDFKIGTTYYGRIKTIAKLENLRLVSGPSNVLSVKAGPEVSMVLGMAGVRYDAKDAKTGNTFNKQRAETAYKELSSWSEGEEDLNIAITEDDKNNAVVNYADEDWLTYIHEDHGTDQKSGMIFFAGVDEKTTPVKAYELLRSETRVGNYKKLKTYSNVGASNQDKMLIKLDETLKLDDGTTKQIYAMQYTSFPTEKTYYYAVRAVAKEKSAPGGYENGWENTTQVGKVQGLTTSAVKNNTKAIQLYWVADDSAKQYYIYKKAKSDSEWPEKPIKKLGASSGKKITYKDASGNAFDVRIANFVNKDSKNDPVKTGTVYLYKVVPVYDTKNESKYTNMESPAVEGVGEATYTQVQNLKVLNESIKKTSINFTDRNGVNGYRIYRLKVKQGVKTIPLENDLTITEDLQDGKTVYLDAKKELIQTIGDPKYWENKEWFDFFYNKGWTEVGDGPWTTVLENTKKLTFTDDTVELGCYYFYAVQPLFIASNGDERSSSSLLITTSALIRNVPLSPTGLKAERRDYKNGAKLTWGLNSKDAFYSSNMIPAVRWSGDGSSGWKFLKKGTNTYTDTSSMGNGTRKYEVAWFYIVGARTDAQEPSVYDLDNASVDGVTYYYVIKGNSATVDYKKPGEIKVSPGSIGISVGQTVSVTASNGTNDEVSFNTDFSYVEVKRKGNTSFTVTGKKKGSTTITFKCGGKSKTINVTIN